MIKQIKLDHENKNKFSKTFKLAFAVCCFFAVTLFANDQPFTTLESSTRTLSIIKPDAVANNQIGNILSRFEKNGLKIAAAKMVKLTKKDAESFYEVHRGKPFYDELVEFMTSGPILVTVLEGHNAIEKNREIMGATDPKKALDGTIRKDFAESVGRNAVHGSDAVDTAKKEIKFFFKKEEIFSR
jgi:nucleoside-diphosphate kinase